MRIAIAGGSGFLGRSLARRLLADGSAVLSLGRRMPAAPAASPAAPPSTAAVTRVAWLPDGTVGSWASALKGVDVVINLAGASIGKRRWSAVEKARIRDSRLLATRSLVGAIRAMANPPRVFVSASAQGYYGSRGDEVLMEESAAGGDFLARVCIDWEREALEARSSVERLVLVRTGLVLDRHEGALPRMLLPFRFFAGGRIGSGRRYLSWIHRDDWVSLVRWAILHREVDGPVNATAPNPATNAEFARCLGRILRRPSIVPMPAFALKLALGEMAESLLLSSQRVVPAKATALGFAFGFPDLDGALFDALRGP
jgi:uncharacterized protein (TIGR01777 family)